MAFAIFLLVLCSICIQPTELFMDNCVYPKWIFTIILSVPIFIFTVSRCMKKQRIHVSPIKLLFYSVCIFITLTLYKDACFVDLLLITIFFVTLCIIFSVNSTILLIDKAIASAVFAGCIYSLPSLGELLSLGNMTFKGTYDNSVGFSLTLSVLTVYSCYYFVHGNKKYRIMNILITLSVIIILIFSCSRIGCISVFISLIILLDTKFKVISLIICVGIFFVLTFVKFDSTRGRAFICKTSLSMLDNYKTILFGKGADGFRNTYMMYQANALTHEDEKQKMLADNVKYPLNECILFVINYGFLRGLLLLLSVYTLFRNSVCDKKTKAMLSTIFIYSMLSYPFKYPVTWIIIANCIAKLQCRRSIYINLINYNRYVSVFTAVIVIFLSYFSFVQLEWNIRWKKMYNSTLFTYSDEILKEYKKLSYGLFARSDFYHNYAAVLLINNKPCEAFETMKKCRIKDYDTMLLMGYICTDMQKYDEALMYFRYAFNMCPNRFVPLFCMYEIYKIKQDKVSQKSLGLLILNKEVKIPSEEINEIKYYVQINNEVL